MSGENKLVIPQEERSRYEENYQYLYLTTDSVSVFKPITVLRAKGAPNEYLVCGRYAGFDERGQLYTPLNEDEQREVVKQLGANKIVRFL
jgi:hypothetical protein